MDYQERLEQFLSEVEGLCEFDAYEAVEFHFSIEESYEVFAKLDELFSE